MEQRRRVAGRCLDRHGLAAGRHSAGERHDSVRRSPDRGSRVAGDVDSTMLPARVRMGRIEDERTQHRPVDRPGPRFRGCCGQRQRATDDHAESAHERPPLLSRLRTAESSRREHPLSILATKYGGTARSVPCRSAARRDPPRAAAERPRPGAPRQQQQRRRARRETRGAVRGRS